MKMENNVKEESLQKISAIKSKLSGGEKLSIEDLKLLFLLNYVEEEENERK